MIASNSAASLSEAYLDEIVLYPTFIASNGGILQGRVIKRRNHNPISQLDRWWSNSFRSIRTIVNRERKHIPVTILFESNQYLAQTDHEGYFELHLPPSKAPAGWHKVSASTQYGSGSGNYMVLLTSTSEQLGVISDIDDTILVSEVRKKLRLIKNTFFKNATQRHAVVEAVAIYQDLAQNNQHLPIFYLSATPRQLYSNLQHILNTLQFPSGITITRRLTRDAKGDSFNIYKYKTTKIEHILTQLPNMQFMLIGDDGEHDPKIYHQIKQRFPQQIKGIWIRRTTSKPLMYTDQKDFYTLGNTLRSR